MSNLGDQLRIINDSVLLRTEKVARAAIKELGERMIDDSPVYTGEFVSNWKVQLNGIDYSTNPVPTGSITAKPKAMLESSVNNLWEGDTLYFTNSVEHAYGVEYLGWAHRGAPQGVVRINAINFSQIVEEQARNIKK